MQKRAEANDGDSGIAARLAAEVGIPIIRRPGADLIALSDGPTFLDACEERGIRILGVEGFYLQGDEVWVDMDRIADFSSVRKAADSISEARRFIEVVSTDDLMLDFVLEVGS